jgi:hypothetical protein
MDENQTENAVPAAPPAPKMSRQRAWQEKRKAAGLCACCGEEPLLTRNYGEKCAQRIREKARARTQAKKRYLGCTSYKVPAAASYKVPAAASAPQVSSPGANSVS